MKLITLLLTMATLTLASCHSNAPRSPELPPGTVLICDSLEAKFLVAEEQIDWLEEQIDWLLHEACWKELFLEEVARNNACYRNWFEKNGLSPNTFYKKKMRIMRIGWTPDCSYRSIDLDWDDCKP